MTWHAVGPSGRDLATGRPPRPPGSPSPAAALAAAPVVTWPLQAVADDGRRVSLADALGVGGARVERLLSRLMGAGARPGGVELARLAAATPAGVVELPLQLVPLSTAVEAAARVDADWLATVEQRRSAPRGLLAEAGRGVELEAALHVTMLLASERLDPADDEDVDAHMASGAQLWLLAAAVAWALTGAGDPFACWAELLLSGVWPVGPSGGRLVVGSSPPRAAASAT